MAKAPKPSNVFISYARVDAPRLRGILKRLIASGLISERDQILKEEDLPAKHGAVREEVKRRIQSASKVIVVWGTASASSQWVNYEIGLADALGKPIIAVLPTSDAIALPASLQNVRVVKVAGDG
jgi:hypothetical protein